MMKKSSSEPLQATGDEDWMMRKSQKPVEPMLPCLLDNSSTSGLEDCDDVMDAASLPTDAKCKESKKSKFLSRLKGPKSKAS